MASQKTKSTVDLEAWTKLVMAGIVNAISGLSQMVGQDIRVTTMESRRIKIKEAPGLFGGPETLAVMVYLGITGSATGHMAVIYAPRTAFDLVDMLMGLDSGSTQDLTEIETSALGEMGNIIGSFFLCTLADETGLDLRPSPPAVMMDMVGAILDVVLAELFLESDEVTLVETAFGTQDKQLDGTFLIMPSPHLVETLVQHLGGS